MFCAIGAICIDIFHIKNLNYMNFTKGYMIYNIKNFILIKLLHNSSKNVKKYFCKLNNLLI